MWLQIDLDTFEAESEGFTQRLHDTGEWYLSPQIKSLKNIAALKDTVSGQAVHINHAYHKISFGRDYLGNCPLLYTVVQNRLLISDEISELIRYWSVSNMPLKFNEQAFALYLSLGYVPQGMTLYKGIYTCKNATIYHWTQGKGIVEDSIFQAIDIAARHGVDELGDVIDAEIHSALQQHSKVDIWCSGGLSSSIVAALSAQYGSDVEMLTLCATDSGENTQSYDSAARASAVAASARKRLHEVAYNEDIFDATLTLMTTSHVAPVLDYITPAKYALAQNTRNFAMTGQGSAGLFPAKCFNPILFAMQQNKLLSVGRVYALAQHGFFRYLESLLVDGRHMTEYVETYLKQQLAVYPGDILRKLFYMETLHKQGSLNLPVSYYAAKRAYVRITHPLATLQTYRAAFCVADAHKYDYPYAGTAMRNLFADLLPAKIVEQPRVTTQLPVYRYMRAKLMHADIFDELDDMSIFHGHALDKVWLVKKNDKMSYKDLKLLYALYLLNKWVKDNQGYKYVESISVAGSRQQQSFAV